MVLLENKLDLFYNLVYKKREDERKLHLDEWEKRLEQEKKDKIKSLEEKTEEKIERRREMAKQKAYEMTAKAKEQRRVLELQKTDEILTVFMDKLREEAKEFTESEDYWDYLQKSLQSTLSTMVPGTYRIAMTQKDWDQFQKQIITLGKEYHMEFIYDVMDPRMIGGYFISNEEDTYNLNNSLEDKIVDHKYQMGMMLHKAFKDEEVL